MAPALTAHPAHPAIPRPIVLPRMSIASHRSLSGDDEPAPSGAGADAGAGAGAGRSLNDLIGLADSHEWSQAEIARALGLNQSSVSRRLTTHRKAEARRQSEPARMTPAEAKAKWRDIQNDPYMTMEERERCQEYMLAEYPDVTMPLADCDHNPADDPAPTSRLDASP